MQVLASSNVAFVFYIILKKKNPSVTPVYEAIFAFLK